jgi:hypothetical protein
VLEVTNEGDKGLLDKWWLRRQGLEVPKRSTSMENT